MSNLIPNHASKHIVDGLSAYLTTSFALTESTTAEELRTFLLDQHNGMFNGPYVRVRLPYAAASNWQNLLGWLPDWFKPYKHQADAFARLRSRDDYGPRRPEPTLVVTGTGSGKTESFLYPILDHCRRAQGEGIKALILYPMNALASDQERRLAQLLTEEAALAGVTAGLFTGEQTTGGRRTVSERGLITDRSVIRDTPPDILLTNYKMLDQLLLREADKALWAKSAETLQYLVLDEFHTYDAAQGTDVAMLLRRLGLTLKQHQSEEFLEPKYADLPLGRVTPVATSATLGDDSGVGGATTMLNFAFTVFGEKLDKSAVVGETLLNVEQWQDTIPDLVGLPLGERKALPTEAEATSVLETVAKRVGAGDAYDAAVHETFCEQIFECEVGLEPAIAAMATHELFLNVFAAARRPLPLAKAETASGGGDLIEPLIKTALSAELRRKLGDKAEEFMALVLSEIAYLRAEFGQARGWDGKKIPGVETHLWVREISRIDRAVGNAQDAEGNATSIFRWSDDGGTAGAGALEFIDSTQRWLPAIYCRHCGRSGWMAGVQPGDDFIETAVQKIRGLSVTNPERTLPLIDATSEVAAGVSRNEEGGSTVKWLNLDMPIITDTEPDAETKENCAVAPVLVYGGDNAQELAKTQQCPSCNEPDSIRYLGSSVATLLSVALSNLFGMDDLDNAEKKTLIFTDSVQDAAHRAGFVQNRARAFALRARIHKAVTGKLEEMRETALRAGDTELAKYDALSVSMSVLAERMMADAQAEETEPEQARALYELLPRDLAAEPRFRGLWKKDASKDARRRAMAATLQRMGIDLALEFGDRVDLPRSLVSTGTVSVSVDVDNETLLEATREMGIVADERELVAWARGIVEKIRIEGGIYHPLFEEYILNNCQPYQLNNRQARAKGVPAFARGGTPNFPRVGKPLTGQAAKNSACMPADSPKGWYTQWTNQLLGKAGGNSQNTASLVKELLKRLAELGVLESFSPGRSRSTDSKASNEDTIYALQPERIAVSMESNPELLECDVCRMHVGVDAGARAAMTGAPCYHLDCEGHYATVESEDNYYRRLYRAHNARTVVSAEHTGLVPTKVRKKVEDQFKMPLAEQEADAPNVLVATPTLEMGIDIGDLSTVMLSSMPNSVANYVQRVGRAGRLSGNSLVVALVRGRGQALTKLEHPLETIAGSVTAPAAYLSARDIMHRQFIAYLIDSNNVAGQLSSLQNAYDVFARSGDSLIDVLLEMAEGDIGGSIDAFSATLREHSSQDVLDELREWAQAPSGMRSDLEEARSQWKKVYHEFLERSEKLTERLLDLKAKTSGAGSEDTELKEELHTVKAANRFVNAQLYEVRNEFWVGALERYGLLPNFTLLDDSVEFKLSVSSFNPEIQEFETEVLEYTRGVSSALTELAPGNTFYVQGVGAKVTTVDLGREQSALTYWRLCSQCSHSEEAQMDANGEPLPGTSCPECGDPQFADGSRLLKVVEMKRVYASVDRSRSVIRDFDDERRSARFQTHLSYKVPEGGYGKAWYLSGSGFGMQYLSRVEMHWLNLGRYAPGSERTYGGNTYSAPLFRVCQHCGHLDSTAGDNSWQDHTAWCKHRDADTEETLEIALGRRLGTQGVLMHLPPLIGVMESTTLPSLIAALRLGFKEFLGGNPDHLDIEPVSVVSDGFAKDVLLIHDRIPGGTGYLAQFQDPHSVRGLLESAYTRLLTCTCADEHREACPSCLLPFARGSQVPLISRGAAVTALGKILADAPSLPEDMNPLNESWDGKIIEDEPQYSAATALEARFIEILRKKLKGSTVITDSVVNNYAHWTIKIPGSPHVWTLREQKHLGYTVPDIFLSTPDPDIRDIAVYLDGEAFHASKEVFRVDDDFAKRNRLYADGYLPISITWKDLDADRSEFVTGSSDGEADEFYMGPNPEVDEAAVEESVLSKPDLEVIELGPVALIVKLLLEPDPKWEVLAEAIAVRALAGVEPDYETGALARDFGQGVELYATETGLGLRLDIDPNAIDARAWRFFLWLSNFVYLVPDYSEVVVNVIGSARPAVLPHEPEAVAGGTERAKPEAASDGSGNADSYSHIEDSMWLEIFEEFEGEEEILTAVNALQRAGFPAPDEGSAGAEVDGILVVGKWADKKLLLVEPGVAAEEAGNTDYTLVDADFDEAPESITSLLKG